MADLPRFENVDLTPTWDDVDPAALDFSVGATDVGVDAVDLDPQPQPPEPEPEPEPEVVEVDAEPEPEFEPPAAEAVAEVEEVGDDSAYWEHEDQFDGGIEPETLPDDFDDLG